MKAIKVSKEYKKMNASLPCNSAVFGNGDNFVYCPNVVLVAYHAKHTYIILLIISYRLENSRFYGRFVGIGIFYNNFSFNGLYGR